MCICVLVLSACMCLGMRKIEKHKEINAALYCSVLTMNLQQHQSFSHASREKPSAYKLSYQNDAHDIKEFYICVYYTIYLHTHYTSLCAYVQIHTCIHTEDGYFHLGKKDE